MIFRKYQNLQIRNFLYFPSFLHVQENDLKKKRLRETYWPLAY